MENMAENHCSKGLLIPLTADTKHRVMNDIKSQTEKQEKHLPNTNRCFCSHKHTTFTEEKSSSKIL